MNLRKFVTTLCHSVAVSIFALTLHGSTPAVAQPSLNQPQLLRQLRHDQPVEALSFAPDSRTLATASRDKKVRLWDVETGKMTGNLAGHSNAVQAVYFNGAILISGSWDKTIRLWDVDTGALKSTLSGHSDVVDAVTLSPDGKTIASGSWDNTIRLWDVDSGDLLQTLQGHKNQVTSVAFSPDGKTLASGSWDNTIRLWDVATAKTRRTLSGHVDWVQSVTFAPDGRTLASASWDNTIRLWDVIGDAPPRILKGHQGRVSGVAFSPDGTLLASVGWDKTLRLWNVATGNVAQTLGEYGDWIQAVAFSPDGSLVATAGFDGIAKVWRIKAALKTNLPNMNVSISVKPPLTPTSPPKLPANLTSPSKSPVMPMSPSELPVVVQPPTTPLPKSQPIDLSSPESAVRSFVGAVNAVDLYQAAACVLGVKPQLAFDSFEAEIKAGKGANALGHSIVTISDVRAEVSGSLATVTFKIELAPTGPDTGDKTTGTARLPLYRQEDKWKIMPRQPETLQTPLAQQEDFLLWVATALQRPNRLIKAAAPPAAP